MRILLAGPDHEENLSIRYLSASLQRAGHDADLIAFNSPADIAAVAREAEQADMVGLSMCFQSRAQEYLQLARLIKSSDPEKLIVAGGHYASCAAEPLLAHHPEIDAIVIHEGEGTLVEIANSKSRPGGFGDVSGIAYREGEDVRFTAPRRTRDDLDGLPFPDRRGPIHLIAGVPTSYMMGSRGCYGSCAYCCITTLHRVAPGRRFRQRSAEQIAQEMAELYHDRGTRQFIFHDDNFLVPSEAMNHARISALEQELNRRGVRDIALVTKCRPADARRDVLRRLKEMGLVRLFLGIESSTERGLATLERRQTVEESMRALDACADLDISAQFTIMTFNPDATEETVRSDIAFMRRYSGNPLNFCRAEIYAGTPLETRMIALGRARGNYLARAYHLTDPVADLACDLSIELFGGRCWNDDSLMQNTIGLDHLSAVAKRFYSGPRQADVCARSAEWVRAVNRDTINLLQELVDLSSSTAGQRVARTNRRLQEIKNQESRSREKLLAEGRQLRTELQALRFGANETGHASSAGLRIARQATAALLAVGIPGLVACKQSPDKNVHTQPPSTPVSTPSQQNHGCCEYAASPLEDGKDEHKKTQTPDGTKKKTPTEQETLGLTEMAAMPLQPQLEPMKQLTGSLTGKVTDPSGAAISNVTVTITNLTTHETVAVKTNEAGRYEAKALKPGRYSVKAQAPTSGFKAGEKTGIEVRFGATESVDLTLQIAQLEQTVTTIDSSGCCEYTPGPLVETEVDVKNPDQAALPEPAVTGTLTGTITDPSGAVFSDAEITITNLKTQETVKTKTNSVGEYSVSGLKAGSYSVTAHVSGFKTHILNGIEVKPGATARADISLQIGNGCCEYVAAPLQVEKVDYIHKMKPFTYYVGDANDHNTFQGIAEVVYGDRKAWPEIFEANRNRIAKAGYIPNGTNITVPKKRQSPKLIYKVKPEYPATARTEHVSGDVVMDVTLRSDGTVDRADVIDGPAPLVDAATTAVKQWRYRLPPRPQPADLKLVVAVTFSKGGKVQIAP